MRKLSKAELDKVLCQHKKWRESGGREGQAADLSGIYLYSIDLRNIDLRDVDLRGVGLYNVRLSGADLRNADLRGINLSAVDLWGTDLRGANLQDAMIGLDKLPLLLGNVLVTKVEEIFLWSFKISTWIEISDEDLELYKELYG